MNVQTAGEHEFGMHRWKELESMFVLGVWVSLGDDDPHIYERHKVG